MDNLGLLQGYKDMEREAERKVARLKERLREAAESARGRVERLERYLAEDAHLDGNGVLQSTAAEVDKLCALYVAAVEERDMLRHYARKAAEAVERDA